MIQTRDIYQGDYCTKYFPQSSLDRFSLDMFTPDKFQKQMVVLSKEENEIQLKIYNSLMIQGAGVLSASIVTILFYNRIPLLRRLQKPWARRLMKVGILLMPLQVQAFFGESKQHMILNQLYAKYAFQYQKYKYNGDIRHLCPNVRLSEV